MHISREQLIREQQMSPFDKKSFINFRTFIHGYVIISVIVAIFSERLTDTSCPDFSLCFLVFLQLWLKLMRNVLLNRPSQSFFSRNGLPVFVFDLSHICLLSTSWVLFLKRKLSIGFCEFMLKESQLHRYIRIFSEPDMTLCYHFKH